LFEHEISSAVESIIDINDRNKYNLALGFFNGYSTEEVDPSGSRFANIKLHYKDINGNEITVVNVPILYPGNAETVDDFKLVFGDELLVLFLDRTLEQWTQQNATVPQNINNKVKDSLNHALCIPISTHHSLIDITSLAIDSSVGRRIIVKSGKKIQIGDDTNELLDLFNQVIEIITIADSGGDTFPGLSVKGNTLAQVHTSLKIIAKTI